MLKDKLANYTLILASGSPRRQQFFKDLDLNFEIRLKEIEEVYPPELQAEAITNYLAELKASAFEDELKEQDAFAILKSLSNATHEVITSVCFKTKAKTDTIFEVTKVTFNALSDQAIHYYLDHYKPYDKAGAYGIQEWIGFVGVSKIEGSYTNVMGMPTDKVFNYLNNLDN
jgi:septum formation protein